MRSRILTQIFLLEHLRYLFNPNTVCHMKCCSFCWLSSSHADVAVVLDNGAGSQATVYLTVSLAGNPRSLIINRPTTDCKAEISPTEKALHDADNAVKTMDLYNAWDKALGRIRWVMDTIDPIAEVRTVWVAYPSLC